MQEARNWFAKMPGCLLKNSTDECREKATKWVAPGEPCLTLFLINYAPSL